MRGRDASLRRRLLLTLITTLAVAIARPIPRLHAASPVDSVFCPAGPPTVTFMVFLSCHEDVLVRLSTKLGTAGAIRLREDRLTANEFRRCVARLAGVQDSELTVELGMVSFANGPDPEARQTEAGDGLAFSALRLPKAIRLRICTLHGGVATEPVVEVATRSGEIVVVPTMVGGIPCVVALRTVPPEYESEGSRALSRRFREKRSEFHESIRQFPASGALAITAGLPSAEVSRLLVEGKSSSRSTLRK